MPRCLTCDGRGQHYVDWAGDFAPCPHCQKGQVSDKIAARQRLRVSQDRRRQLKRNPPRWNRYPAYHLQQVRLHWTDWDTIGSVEWKTIRVVETVGYGLYLVRQWNKEDAGASDFGSPYRLVSPTNRVMTYEGLEGEEALAAHHYPVPGEY